MIEHLYKYYVTVLKINNYLCNNMLVENGTEIITESDFWQGTIVYLQLYTNKEINPAEVVANRTNVVTQYNETFLKDNELEELW